MWANQPSIDKCVQAYDEVLVCYLSHTEFDPLKLYIVLSDGHWIVAGGRPSSRRVRPPTTTDAAARDGVQGLSSVKCRRLKINVIENPQ